MGIPMDFKNGFINEMTMRANQGGTISFQLENALGTTAHFFAGYLSGKAIRKAIDRAMAKKGKLPMGKLFYNKLDGAPAMIGDKSGRVDGNQTTNQYRPEKVETDVEAKHEQSDSDERTGTTRITTEDTNANETVGKN